MQEENKKQEIQFIHCLECKSIGEDEKGKDCSNCRGLGLGSFFLGKFLYWNASITKANISLRKLKQFMNLIIDLASYLVFIVGFSSLCYHFFINTSLKINEIINFYQEKNILIIMFWIGLLALLFIIYRTSERKAGKQKIKEIKIGRTKTFPNNWNELVKYKKKLEISSGYKEKTLQIIEDSHLLALKLRHKEVTPVHLFSSILKSRKAVVLFTRLNVSGKKLLKKLNNYLEKQDKELKKESDLKLSKEVKEILIAGYTEAYDLNQKHVNVLNIIFFCIEKNKFLREILLDFKVDQNKIKNTIEWFRIDKKLLENYKHYKRVARFKPKTVMDRAYTAQATPLLNSYAYDLTLAAKWGRLPLCTARDKEIKQIFDTFKSGRNGIILTGQEGVGKKTIIHGIAARMVEEKVPDFLKDKRLLELDIAHLVSGADPSQAEERLLIILNEIARAGNIILYIENLENLIGISAGEEESLELSEVLANALDRKSIYFLSAAEETNYIKYIEKTAIGNSLDRIKIKEPEGNQAIQIIESKISTLEAKHKIFFSYNALEAAILLSSKFIHDKYLPQKAINILEKTAVRKAGESIKGKVSICDKNDVAKTIQQITDIPIEDLEQKEAETLLNLEKEIHKYMINQEEAVSAIADSLRRARTQLREGKRPISSFLFMGPTGVGKTELAKTITKVYFKKKEYLIRLDMSEYQHEDSVKKMIGSTGSTGFLTEEVRQKPFSLILLDEFEKAHPKIFNLFLQVMDDGRLSDGEGKTIDFTNSIIIATSNAGSNYIQREMVAGTPTEEIKKALINEHLNKILRPELINRFDGIIVFKPLSRENIVDITKLMLKKIKKMLKEKGILFETTEGGISKLAEEGYDPKFGARPLRRLLQKKIENEIAKHILAGNLGRRDTVVINNNAQIEIKKAEEL